MLAGMSSQRLAALGPKRGHIYHMVRFGIALKPEFTDRERSKAGCVGAGRAEVSERIAGEGVDRPGGGLANGEVIGVRQADVVPGPGGALGQDEVGTQFADSVDNTADQLVGHGDGAIGEAVEEPDISHPENTSGAALFIPAPPAHLPAFGTGLEPPGVTAGDQQICHPGAARDPGGHRARSPEVNVIRMCHHGQNHSHLAIVAHRIT